jgi:hypothetical protein
MIFKTNLEKEKIDVINESSEGQYSNDFEHDSIDVKA